MVPYKNGTYAHISDELKHSTISMPLEIFTSIVKDSGELITRSQMLSVSVIITYFSRLKFYLKYVYCILYRVRSFY